MTPEMEHDLFAAYANGRLLPEQQKDLKTLLTQSAAARVRFAEFMEDTTLFIQVACELSAAPTEMEPVILTPSAPRARHLPLWLAAAAAVLLTGIIALWHPAARPAKTDAQLPVQQLETRPAGSVAGSEPFVASRVDGSMDAWMKDFPYETYAGNWLITNKEPLELGGGAISITLESGVLVTIEGPAVFRVVTADRIELTHGRLYAEVPPGMSNFVVTSPLGTVIDLGTRFGFDVRLNGTASLHVFQGIVEYWPPDSDTAYVQRLRAGEAIGVDGKGNTSPEPFGSERFLHIPDQRPTTSFVKWNCETDADGFLFGFGQPADLAPTGQPPYPTDGKFGGGIRFDDTNSGLIGNWSSITGPAPRTIAAWIRIPPGNRETTPLIIAGWGCPQTDEAWQLSWNSNPLIGVPGALMTTTGRAKVCGSTDLRDGRWHHVASVFIGTDSADLATHVRMYVDGRLESLSHADSRAIHTVTGMLSVGATPDDTTRPRAVVTIDELIILDAALSAAEVRELMLPPKEAAK